ncbi:MAG: hypothetical protein IJW94_03695 [Oscillospiraceae bacterium]|nr:hypothetical protein [Oscillospiraceae bacterium]
MDIKKETEVALSGEPTQVQLEAINAQAKAKLTKEQVYVFSLRLCDDQVDRDYERFDTAALPELAKMFIGKTGIIDHKWSSDSQVARIFETQVVCEDGVSYIKAWAYIRRGGQAEEVIADIEAGIKKEVSVGCAMGRSVCSVCGGEYGTCGHQKGEVYDGGLCCAILKEPMDAYEFSFVAVPAQPQAGVIKGMGMGKRRLKELAEEFGAQQEYRALFKQAQLGLQYEKQLKDEVVRLCLSLDLGAEEPVLRSVVEKAAAEDLLELKKALEKRLRQCMPMALQLPGNKEFEEGVESGYLI